ncbi:uncharacterized protein LOC143430640 [Xylocopa sonorina]|uniref:uncharacterized protein LOC143430640 n=1 Tax=Xylocopa sonorina TaxID=1818115 RepID=UPI00403AA55A
MQSIFNLRKRCSISTYQPISRFNRAIKSRLITAVNFSLYFRGLMAGDVLNPLSTIIDLLQFNVLGVPVVHEITEWDFDPEVGKQRRVRYEQENGRRGELAIARLGMGLGYKQPWGVVVPRSSRNG